MTRVAARHDEHSDQRPGQSNFGPHVLSIPPVALGATCASSPAVELRSGQEESLRSTTAVQSTAMGNAAMDIDIDDSQVSPVIQPTTLGSQVGHDSSHVQSDDTQFSLFNLFDGQYYFDGFTFRFSQILTLTAGLHILYLCSGLPRPGDLAHCADQLKMRLTCIDI